MLPTTARQASLSLGKKSINEMVPRKIRFTWNPQLMKGYGRVIRSRIPMIGQWFTVGLVLMGWPFLASAWDREFVRQDSVFVPL
ncbi:hypothetical protein WICPIJ_005865 [Wickerhamomyces pijperi]|uniref:Uncharacterized protein n=1 Tax=Wickerhamomyces pijperi TaxID=599730 RepID=A0A9P8Q369_WICPI|nr:hypothetical protein WICPIJ_005865 [Wickerhamomyces pijperi]